MKTDVFMVQLQREYASKQTLPARKKELEEIIRDQVIQNHKRNMKNEKMALMEAKQKASDLSRKYPDKKIYILVDGEGDCSLSFNPVVPGHEVMHCYRNGSEIALEVNTPEPIVTPKTKSKNKTTEQMTTASKKAAPAKKSAAAKKSAPAKSAKKAAAKKESKPRVDLTGKKFAPMKIKDIIKLLKAGKKVYNEAGILNVKRLQKKTNQELTRDVVVI